VNGRRHERKIPVTLTVGSQGRTCASRFRTVGGKKKSCKSSIAHSTTFFKVG
jgi:hypothetical protein